MEEISLGGNITLVGFNEVSSAELIIVKKIVGNYVKGYAENGDLECITITYKPEGDTHSCSVSLKIADSEKKAESSSSNLFVSLDNALKQVK